MPRTERDVALLAGGALLGAALASLMLRRGSKARPSSRFVLLGDSITQYSFAEGGFGAMIADRYQRRVDVCCRGYSGYNSRWVLELLPNICDRSGGDSVTRLVVVFFGANDSSLPEHNLRQHVPLGEYADNLKAIAAALRRQCPAARVVFVTPPPLDEGTYLKQRFAGNPPVLSRTNAVAGAYAAAVEAVAAELGAPCVNIWRDMQAAAPGGEWCSFLSDGLHLSKTGNAFVGEAILKTIDAALPELAVVPCSHSGSPGNSGSSSDLPADGPWHDQIKDPGDYKSKFRA